MDEEKPKGNVIRYRGNNPIANPPNIRSMIVEDLGYCCPWLFFRGFRKSSLIAARLGVATRSIQVVKASCDNGYEECTNAPTCMKGKLAIIKTR